MVSPVSGTIVATNEEVLKSPKLVNDDPYGKGWLIVINPTNLEEDMTKLVKGDQAVEWLKKQIKEVAKEAASS